MKPMKQWITPVLAALSLFVFAACSNTSEIIATGLSVELNKIERTADGRVEVSWQLNNPNVVPYLVDRVSHKVTLDGEEIGTISDSTRLGLPKQGKEGRTNTLTLANAAAAERVAQAATRGSANYRLESTLWLLIVDDDIVKSTLSKSGTVPVSSQ